MNNVNLIRGDCLEKMKDIPDGSIDMILCYLPYGITQNKWDSVIDFNLLWSSYNRIIKKNGVVVLFAQSPFDKHLGFSNIKMFKYEWIWEKNQGTGFLNAKKMPLKTHENILIFYNNPPTYNPQMRLGFSPYIKKGGGDRSKNYGALKEIGKSNSKGNRYPITVLKFKRDKLKLHPTQKPVALLEYLIKTYTNENELVLDNCMGSGSTGISCLNTNRKFIGIEKDDHYFEVAKNRIENHQPPSAVF